jgi:hypothetical protein
VLERAFPGAGEAGGDPLWALVDCWRPRAMPARARAKPLGVSLAPNAMRGQRKVFPELKRLPEWVRTAIRYPADLVAAATRRL